MKKNLLLKKVISITLVCSLLALMIPQQSLAVNPIVQDIYTADPAPMVSSDGRIYVYTSHDEDELIDNFYTMNDWKCYSTADMVNWTDHGTVMAYDTFDWACENSAWAGQCIERDGKYYYYVPLGLKTNRWATVIGVGVSDSPTGPFEDAIGKPLVSIGSGNIDPTVWIDDDGQAYLYWGNPDLKAVKLKDNMIETDGEVKVWKLKGQDLTEEEVSDIQEQFGTQSKFDFEKNKETSDYNIRPTLFEEGPWFYKRDNLYYMVYASNGIPERVDYSTSTSPLGPWKYVGMIMNDKYDSKGTGSFTNHPGIIDYRGHSYFFYHTGKLPDGSGYHRSVAVEEFTYNEDGTIPEVPFTDEGVEPIQQLNPYERVEAETFAWGEGVEKEDCSEGGRNLCEISDKDNVRIQNVGFGEHGAVKFTVSTASTKEVGTTAGTIELYLDSPNGEFIGSVDVKASGADNQWVSQSIEIPEVKGEHDLYMVFSGEGDELFKFDYWQFTQKEVPVSPTPSEPVSPTPDVTPIPVPTTSVIPDTPKQTEFPQVVNPGKGSIKSVKNVKKKSVKITIKKNNKASGYQIKYALNAKLTKGKKLVNTKRNIVTIKRLKKGKKYYFSVRPYKFAIDGRKVYGKFGTVKKVRIKK